MAWLPAEKFQKKKIKIIHIQHGMVIIFNSPKPQDLLPGQVGPGGGFEHEETRRLGRKMLNGI